MLFLCSNGTSRLRTNTDDGVDFRNASMVVLLRRAASPWCNTRPHVGVDDLIRRLGGAQGVPDPDPGPDEAPPFSHPKDSCCFAPSADHYAMPTQAAVMHRVWLAVSIIVCDLVDGGGGDV